MNKEPEKIADATDSVREIENNQFITFGSAITLCLITAALTLAGTYLLITSPKDYLGIKNTNVQRVVSLDFDRILEAGVQSALARSSNDATIDYKSSADQYNERVKVVVDELTSAGFIVINQRALISTPKNDDLTAYVIERAAKQNPATNGAKQ